MSVKPKYKTDNRPQLLGWAPGEYLCNCLQCDDQFIGDKRAAMCADCAYLMPEPKETDEKPLPCPFCGDLPVLNQSLLMTRIECGNLRCTARTSTRAIHGVANKNSEVKAINLWNTRANTEQSDALDNELRRWQDAIRNEFLEVVPDAMIDGGGCDSGDPLDFTLAEISQGISAIKAASEDPRDEQLREAFRLNCKYSDLLIECGEEYSEDRMQIIHWLRANIQHKPANIDAAWLTGEASNEEETEPYPHMKNMRENGYTWDGAE